MTIQFYYKKTNIDIPKEKSDDWLFVSCDKVYADNFKTFESQSSVIGFEDLCDERPEIGWRVVPDHTALVRQLVEALEETLDDSRECLINDESRWGGFRKDRIQYRKDQIAKYEALITAAKEAGF